MICEDKETNDNWKKNNNFILNINYLLYTLEPPFSEGFGRCLR